MRLEPVRLESIGGGAAAEFFQRELEAVLRDIDDPNTKAEAVRSITLKISFHPTADRATAGVDINCQSKLAGLMPAATMVHLTRSGARLVALARDPNQQEMFNEEDRPKVVQGGADAQR